MDEYSYYQYVCAEREWTKFLVHHLTPCSKDGTERRLESQCDEYISKEIHIGAIHKKILDDKSVPYIVFQSENDVYWCIKSNRSEKSWEDICELICGGNTLQILCMKYEDKKNQYILIDIYPLSVFV